MHPAEVLIRARRSHKRFAPLALDRSQLEPLIELATLAPNHRLSQPWRFAVLLPPAIAQLASALRAWQVEGGEPSYTVDDAKLAKLVDGYLPSLAALIQVCCHRHGSPLQQAEDRDATAAAVQNLLLGIEARGWAGFWSSSAPLRSPAMLRRLGFDPAHDDFVASIWIGGRDSEPIMPARQALDRVTRWLDASDL